MTNQFKLHDEPQKPAERFALDVVEERDNPAGLRKAVVKVLGLTNVRLAEITGLSDPTIGQWVNGTGTAWQKNRERITAALILAYVEKYKPNGFDTIPPFENL